MIVFIKKNTAHTYTEVIMGFVWHYFLSIQTSHKLNRALIESKSNTKHQSPNFHFHQFWLRFLENQKEHNHKKRGKVLTKAIVNEIIEGMGVAVVSELVVGGREFLEALKSYGIEIPTEFRVLSENHSSAGNESVDQRFLAHFFLMDQVIRVSNERDLRFCVISMFSCFKITRISLLFFFSCCFPSSLSFFRWERKRKREREAGEREGFNEMF